ncbi:MAG: tyrosine-type recombinase/integrase [Candidatus Cybelea sp.]
MRVRKYKKAANGEGSVKWYPSMRRIVGQVRRGGKIIARKYGTPGVNTAVEEQIVWAQLRPFVDLPAEADASTTVGSALTAYVSRAKLAPSTRSRYATAGAYLSDRFTAKRVIDVKPSDIRAALESITSERGAKMDRTKQIVYKLLCAVFARALGDALITRNAVKAVEMPQYHRKEKTRVFTAWEQGFILRANADLGGANEALLLLALSMPVRPCEVYALRRCDVSLSTRKAQIVNDLIATAESGHKPVLGPLKTPESRRDVFLSDAVAAALTKLLQSQMAAGRTTPESFVFTSPDGMPIRHSNLARNWWKPLLKKAAELAEKAAREAGDDDYRFPKDAGPYSLRHTAIENLKAAGVPLDVIHTLAGHRSLQTTMEHYNQPTEQRKLDAAKAVGNWLAANGSSTRSSTG